MRSRNTIGPGFRCLALALLVSIPLASAGRAQTVTQTPVPAAGPEVRLADNVYVIPDKRAKSIAGWLIVKAGCADEADGNCLGIAHYLEHLLFINRDSENKSKVSMFADGSGNGWTTHRSTVYFQRFPSRIESNVENLDKLVGFFAGLLVDVKADPDQAGRERNVVLQEYQQNTGRNPYARFGVKLADALMPAEPLGQRVIGSPETIKAFSIEAARAFHARWYSKSNAILVLHGPVDPESVKPLIARHFDPLPAKAVPAHVWTQPRGYPVAAQTLRESDKEAKQISVSFDKVVTFPEVEGERRGNAAARAVLSSFLSSRLRSSPLDVMMEKESIVMQGRLGMSAIRLGTARVGFSAVPAEGVTPEKVLDTARGYIAGLAKTGINAATVDRLKQRIKNETALLAQQPAQYADALVSWLSAHENYKDWLDYDVHLEAVTVAHVNRMVALLALPGREVVGVMLPAEKSSTSANTPPAFNSAQ